MIELLFTQGTSSSLMPGFQLRFDNYTATIRLRRIALASKNEHVNFSS